MSPTAIEQLQPSVLSNQMEALGGDVDLSELNLIFRGAEPLDIRRIVTGGTILRTIEGASTLTIPVRDTDRSLLRSKHLSERVDVKIDGLWFRLIHVGKTGGDLTLVFEDREVAVLRTYPKKNAAHNGYLVRNATKVTRPEFARMLVREVKEFAHPIRFICPAFDRQQKIRKQADLSGDKTKLIERGLAFAPGAHVTVKGNEADIEQLRNIAAVLDTGLHYNKNQEGAKVADSQLRKLLVCAVMTATQESVFRTGATNGTHVGLFQQDAREGTVWRSLGGASRDPVKDANAFYIQAVTEVGFNPREDYANVCAHVQGYPHPGDYAQWRAEAEQTVTSYIGSSGDAWSTGGGGAGSLVLGETAFQFVRGRVSVENGVRKFVREDNWDCLGRLADEVNWRRFCVSGAVYFISEVELFRSAPQMTISEDTDGVLALDADFTVGKRDATLPLTARIGRWSAPPGTVVVVEKMGHLDGRWLVASISRPIFSATASINLVKPRPVIPESESPEFKTNAVPTLQNSGNKTDDVTGEKFQVGGALVAPVPRKYLTGRSSLHTTSGSSNEKYSAGDAWGRTATDFFAAAGSPVIAVESGKIARFSGHPPFEGAVLGAGGPLGWSIYLQGDSGTVYYYTHLNTRIVAVGQRVTVGQQIATVADYKSYGRPDHTHVGCHLGPVTGQMLHDAPAAETA